MNRELKQNKACSEFLRELLDMIMDHMLILKGKEDEKTDNRWSSVQIYSRLAAMVQKCEKEPAYASNIAAYQVNR